jgi:CubicO group peptidase (beta-lactamase class C family)
MRRKMITGLSIGVVDDQEIVWSEGFGYADKEGEIKADADTVYRIGSISKLFTAMAVMQLADRGYIDIDQPLKFYLPEFDINSRFEDTKPVTIHSILTHHSGLPSDRFSGAVYVSQPPEDYTKEFYKLAGQMKDAYMTRPPDKVFGYSNIGYSLLGTVVSRVSGQDFIEYVEESILKPVGMKHSSFVENETIEPHMSKGYSWGKEEEPYYIRDIPAGAFLSSANDLSMFMKMIFADGKSGDTQILKSETLRRMLEPQNIGLPMDLDFRIGYAFWYSVSEEFGSVNVIVHGGYLPPFNCMLATIPEHKLGVIALSNSKGAMYSTREIATELIKLAYETKTGKKLPDVKKKSDRTPDDNKIQTYRGYYASPLGMIEINIKGNDLKARLFGLNFDLIPKSDSAFSMQAKLLGFIPLKSDLLESINLSFHEIEGNRYAGLYVSGIFMGVAQKFSPYEVPDEWLERTGRYSVINPDEGQRGHLVFRDMKIKYDKKKKIMLISVNMYNKNMSFPLLPVSEDEAVTIGDGRNLGETIKFVEKDDGTHILFSGFEFRLN